MLKSFFTAKRCARAGVIAALYALLTVALQPFSFGIFQFRVSEALTVLPAIFPEAIPALYSVRNRDPHIYNRGVDYRRGRGRRRIYVRHGALLFDSQNNVRF